MILGIALILTCFFFTLSLLFIVVFGLRLWNCVNSGGSDVASDNNNTRQRRHKSKQKYFSFCFSHFAETMQESWELRKVGGLRKKQRKKKMFRGIASKGSGIGGDGRQS